MADSVTNLDLIAVGQAGKEDTANELFDALSPAALYGRRAATCTGTTWGYYGGRLNSTGIANGTIALSSGTNYIVAQRTSGVVSAALSSGNFVSTGTYIPLYVAVCNGTTVSSYTDYRLGVGPWSAASSTGTGTGGSSMTSLGPCGFTLTAIALPYTSLDY